MLDLLRLVRRTAVTAIPPLVPYLDMLRWVFIAVALGGIPGLATPHRRKPVTRDQRRNTDPIAPETASAGSLDPASMRSRAPPKPSVTAARPHRTLQIPLAQRS